MWEIVSDERSILITTDSVYDASDAYISPIYFYKTVYNFHTDVSYYSSIMSRNPILVILSLRAWWCVMKGIDGELEIGAFVDFSSVVEHNNRWGSEWGVSICCSSDGRKDWSQVARTRGSHNLWPIFSPTSALGHWSEDIVHSSLHTKDIASPMQL